MAETGTPSEGPTDESLGEGTAKIINLLKLRCNRTLAKSDEEAIR